MEDCAGRVPALGHTHPPSCQMPCSNMPPPPWHGAASRQPRAASLPPAGAARWRPPPSSSHPAPAVPSQPGPRRYTRWPPPPTPRTTPRAPRAAAHCPPRPSLSLLAAAAASCWPSALALIQGRHLPPPLGRLPQSAVSLGTLYHCPRPPPARHAAPPAPPAAAPPRRAGLGWQGGGGRWLLSPGPCRWRRTLPACTLCGGGQGGDHGGCVARSVAWLGCCVARLLRGMQGSQGRLCGVEPQEANSISRLTHLNAGATGGALHPSALAPCLACAVSGVDSKHGNPRQRGLQQWAVGCVISSRAAQCQSAKVQALGAHQQETQDCSTGQPVYDHMCLWLDK